jgi:predicted nucleic acid-binding protein
LIVADTNILAYLYLPCEHTALIEQLLRQEPEWAAPVLWRSEFRNVLALYLRKGLLSFEQAYSIQADAEHLLNAHEFEMDSFDVLSIANSSPISAYDAEFVALARRQDIPMATMDSKVLSEFPDIARTPESLLHEQPGS